MIHSLLEEIQKRIELSVKEIDLLSKYFQITAKRHNDYLVTEDSKPLYLYFIVDGYVRNFYNDDGNEITTQISTKKDFVTSFESFLNSTNSTENIQCTTDSTLLRISKDDYENLYKEVSNWSLFCKGVYEDYIKKISERAKSLQNLSATDRYLKLLNNQPGIAQNTAVKHLASYLGIKPQSLSRIRKEIIK